MIENVYELSPLQEGIYYHWLAESSSSLYFLQTSYRVRAKVLDIEKLKGAYDQLTARHAVLRTSFSNEYAGRSLQIVRKEVPSNFTYEKLDSQADRQAQVELIRQQDREKGFDLSRGSQMRLHVIDLSEGEYEFIWSHHHILMDGWCVSVLINDFNVLLSAAIKGSTVSLPPVMPYSNYINWLKAIDRERSLSYWKDYLKGYSSLAEIPFKAARGADSIYIESGEHLQIGGDLFKKVDALCSGLGITHNTFVQGVWGYLLSRYNNTHDVVFGAVVSGRPADLPGVEEMIGLFSNTIPVRVKYDPDDTPVELLKSLQEQSIESTSHHYMNLAEVQSQSELGMDLMNHIMIFQNYAVKEPGSEGAVNSRGEEGLFIESMEVIDQSNYDFNILIAPSSVSLNISIRYNVNRYDNTSLKHLVTHFDKLIAAFAQNADQPLRTFDYLSEEEKHQLLFTFNDTAVAFPKDKTIVDLFEEQAAKTPDNIAIVFAEKELTYRELNERSNQLAHYLKENYDIQPDDLIGIQLDRSEWMIISILGVLKAGGAYVPIDPEYPSSRKEYIVKDSSIDLLITEASFIYDIGYYEGKVFAIDVEFDSENYNSGELSKTCTPANLAYVMYTSGSTGMPKGVMVEHRSIVRLVYNTNFFTPATNDKLLLTGALSFDATTFEIWSMLLLGGQLHLLSQDRLMNVAAFKETIQQEEITVLWLTAAWFNQIVDTDLSFFSSLRYLVSGGDKMSPIHVNKVKKAYPQLEVVNGYGPTENTTFSACYRVENKEYNESIPIGKPIANSQVYILDPEMRPVPFGVAGEIYAGGDGLARGYLNQEALTREKFIANPFKAGERLYKTGDLGRWLPDGNIEFMGRKDDQVKIRGYRIEPGEIEHALLNYEEISQAVVLAKEDGSGEKELIAYITSNVEQNISDLRDYLKERLPSYMLPAYFVQLEAMPLTANGKVDKKSLPDPEGLGLMSGVEYVAPRTELEAKLVKIWEEVLERENIGVNDDFFTLGGHSLKAVRLSNEYQKELSVKVALKDLFAHTSVASHAVLIASSTREAFVQIEKLIPQASYAISDGQRRLWILSQFEGGSAAYNIPGSIYLNQDIEIENFKRAIDATIERHEILRTVFRQDESAEIRQWILERKDLGFTIDYLDFSKEANKQEKTEAYISADAYRAFDLAKGPLLRAALLQVAEAEYVFYFNMHHIISDGWSMEVLTKDVLKYYEAYKAGKAPELKELRIQYKDYSAWQLAQLNRESFKAHRAYWLDKLSGELPLLDLPGSKQRPQVNTYKGQGLATYLDKATTAKLKGYTRENGGSLFMGLLASWNVLMYRYTSQQDIIIGTPVAGRDHTDLEDQMGFYVNTLALRNEVNAEESFDSFYSRVKEDTLKSYSHQMYPFDRLVEDLDLRRDTSRSAVFDVMLILQNNGERIEGVELSEEALNKTVDQGYRTSKFDIEIAAQEIGDYLSLNVVFNPDVYEKAMVEGLIRHYKQLLTALLETPEEKISQIDYLSEQEKNELLVTFNDTAVVYPKDKTIVDLFEEQASKTPDNVAVVFEETELTYRQLNEKSNQLAHYLRENYDIQPDDLIGIKQERSEWMIVSILGVLKAGGAYVPIDPEYPQERIGYIEKDTQYKVCLDERELRAFKESEERYFTERPGSKTKPDNLVYVIYTSGSTGNPKGVMVEHSGLVNRMLWMKRDLEVTEADVFLQKTPVTFDVSVWELLLPLVCGSKLVFATPDGHKDPVYLDRILETQKISIIHFVPSMLSAALETIKWDRLESLRHVVCSGEALPKRIEESFKEKAPFSSLHNYYGPTEASIDVTAINLSLHPTEGNEVSIGKPVDNTSIYIVNEKNALQPVGVLGEILIGGDQVARGYLKREALTKQKFIPSPFKEGERLYKTGDLGRWLPDGNIEFIGRKDDQVKIRGYRIELGEIEHALLTHEAIEQTVVLAKENESGEKEVVAYITSSVEQNANDLRAYLKERLPVYMLPAYFIQLEAMPLTANGKVDKKSLPDPEGLGLSSGVEYVAPRNEFEVNMVKIWSEILRVNKEKLGVKDRFFELGGDSIKVIRLLAAIRKEMHYEFSINEIYKNDTIEELLQYAKGNKNEIDLKNEWRSEIEKSIRSEIERLKERILSSSSILNKENIEDIYPMSDIEKGMVFGYEMNKGTGTYHDQMVFRRIFYEFDITRFNLALDLLTEKHSILRTSFNLSDFEREVQIVHKAVKPNLNFKDLSVLTGEQQEEEIRAFMRSELDTIDVSKAPLWSMSVFSLGDDNYIFLFQFHHAIIDGWSQASFMTELNNLYLKLGEDINYKPSVLRSSYKDVIIQHEIIKADDSIKNYWKSELAEYERLDLLTDQEELAVYSYTHDNTYLERIEDVARALNTTVKVVSLSAYLYTLKILSGNSQIVTGLVTNTRPNTEDGDRILGCFLNSIPLKFEVDENLQCTDFIMAVHKKVIELKNNETLSLLEISSVTKELHASNPFFDVLFSYVDFHIYQDVQEGELKEGSAISAKSSINISEHERTNTFLDFVVSATGGIYNIRIKANKRLNSSLPLEYVGNLFFKVLGLILKDQSKLLRDVDYLSEAERDQLLVTFNDTAVSYPKYKTIVDLFEEQALKTPDNIALVFAEKELTYRELNEKSNQLAAYLQKNYDIQPDDLIGIQLDRSEWMIISILGVLKAGGAYVPIDPEYPSSRKEYIVKDSSLKLLITEANFIYDIDYYEGEIFAIDVEFDPDNYNSEALTGLAAPGHLAYVIYTSGSTGNPKGVMVEHASLANYVKWGQSNYSNDSSPLNFGLFTSLSFDLTVTSIYLPLISGGELTIFNSTSDVSTIVKEYFESEVSCIKITPAHISLLGQLGLESTKIQAAIVGGEKLEHTHVEILRALNPAIRIYNEYGPTESTVGCTIKEIGLEKEAISIGKPISNTQIYILSETEELQPVGVIGEICIGGDGLTRGYLNQEALTKEKFISSPFKEGERLYRTGDLGRWLPDGNIEFIGRKDDQVKIRGYRIELGEIEHALLSHEEIKEAVVLAKEDGSGEKELVAYITSRVEQNTSELRAYLKQTLPEYMLPAYFVQLEVMPLTANGKVDKKSLPDPEGLGLSSGVEYVAPRNDLEAKLVKIWEEVLEKENIGVNDDFFALGGHSLKAIRLGNEYQKELSAKLSLKELFAHTSVASHAVLIASSAREAFVQIEKVTPQASYAISDGQRRLWVLSQFEGGSAAYNIPGSIYLNQDIDIENFRRAIDATIERHEILRTVFREDESGEIRQWVLERKYLGFTIDYRDFRKEANKQEKAEAYIAADAYRAFDLAKGPLLRAALLQVAEAEYVFYFNMHHIISDGWSMEVLTKDVLQYYEAYKAGKAPGLDELRIQYKDYSAWQLAQLNGESFKAHRAYWLNKLSGELPLLDLPGSKQRPPANTYKGQGLATYLDKATTAKLKGYTQKNGGSLFMGLLASWNVLMYRYTSQKDIIIGAPVAGREHADLEDQMGFYLNTLALRNEVNPEESFDSFYSRVKEDTVKSYNHQMYPFDRLVEELKLQRDTSRSAVFDVMLSLQNNGKRIEGVELSEEALNKTVDQGYSTSKFDIAVTAQEMGDYLSLNVVFNQDVYEKSMVEGLIRHYKQLLNALLETPEEKISQIDYLSEQENHELLVTFNDTAVSYPKDKTIVDLFEEQVSKTPDHVAVVFEDTELTYQELNERSNQLAHYLRENYDIQPDDLIGIKQERSEWMIISILGALKSGGAYVPIDLDYPEERIAYMLDDSCCKVCVDEKELIRFKDAQNEYPKNQVTTEVKANNLAYVIYTSGSTGKPKGVLIEHRSLINYNNWFTVTHKISQEDSSVVISSPSFDGILTCIYGCILNGGSLHLLRKEIINSPAEFIHYVKSKEITFLKATPPYLNLVINSERSDELLKCKALRFIMTGGDKVDLSYVNRIINDSSIYVINHYGPTESTIGSASFIITSQNLIAFNVHQSIGHPVFNTQIYFLNEALELQPQGVIGEMYIGGDGLARGYLNQPKLSAEKFIASPFKEGERLYKTGDLGRWLEDGNIEFIGRKDGQVKIRGYRIELGEIEHALLNHEEIKQAVVLARENQSGEKELVAYVTSAIEQNASDLRSYLSDTLPAYMLPAYFVQLKAMPLTANGKVDRKSLPDPEGLGLSSAVEYVAPGTELEEKLVKIWEEVLGRDNIGMNDDFFALGGHSLKAIRLSNEYQKELSVKLSLKELFTHTSVSSHVALIASSAREVFVQIEKVTPQASYAISDGQRRLWVLSQFDGGSAAYNMPRSIYLNQDIEIENFKRAIDSTIERHEILRTVFREDESGEIRQWVLERKDLGFTIDYQDLSKAANKQEKAEAYIAADAYRAFDLAKGPLLRAALLQVAAAEYVFYFNMHHIISDGWSMEVLSKDVLKYYESYKAGKEPGLEELRIQYKDYSAWQLARLNEGAFKAHRAYWLDKLSGALPLLDLPGSKNRPQANTYNGQRLATYVDKAATAKLKTYTRENGGSLFMGLLASWNVLMYRYTSQRDIIIGTPVAGREHADLEDQIGFYINTLALRNEVNPEESFDNFYQSVKEDTLKSYNHQMYPFDRLVEELSLQRDTSRSAVFDVMLILQNNGERIEGFELSEEALHQTVDQGYGRSKFDIEITAQEIGDYLSLNVIFNPAVYEKAMVEGLIRHYKQLLNVLLETPEERISQIDYLSEQEKHELLVTFNDTAVAYPKEKTVVDLFEEQAAKTPDHVAVVFEETELTYRKLSERSNQLAHYLRDNYDIQPDDLLSIKQTRSEWMIISILGVLKAGGAYVPIDPEYPQERIDYIAEDTRCKVCLDETELNKFKESKDRYSKEPVTFTAKSGNLAYVIYTSGSTGNPKGVLISHGSLYTSTCTRNAYYDVLGSYLLIPSFSFDSSVAVLWGSLTGGSTLCIVEDNHLKDLSRITGFITEHAIACILCIPSYYQLLLSYSTSGKLPFKRVILAGETLSGSLVEKHFSLLPECVLYNEYGPTENTVWSTVACIEKETQKVHIGQPIGNTKVYIVGAGNKLVPIGVTGEICIGGNGLASGYLNQEALTQEKFISSPFREGERLYRTGDLGRWLPDGNIEFIGRKDDQVKIRGYRIELGEIEHALLTHSAIEQAIVLAKENQSGEKELVAYITSNVEQNTSDLRAYLKDTLPTYMLPAHFVQLKAMPLTANGKVDKKSLPDPGGLGLTSGVEYVAPKNKTEEKLIEIWVMVLGQENIGMNDDFFDLGGFSMKAIGLVAEYNKSFNVRLTIQELFEKTKLYEHARIIETRMWLNTSSEEKTLNTETIEF